MTRKGQIALEWPYDMDICLKGPRSFQNLVFNVINKSNKTFKMAATAQADESYSTSLADINSVYDLIWYRWASQLNYEYNRYSKIWISWKSCFNSNDEFLALFNSSW